MKKLIALLSVSLLFGCTDEYSREKTIRYLANYVDNIEPMEGCDVYGDFSDGYDIGNICVKLVSVSSERGYELTFDPERPFISAQYNTKSNNQTLIESDIEYSLKNAKYNPNINSVSFNKLPLAVEEPIAYSVDSFAANLLECSMLNSDGGIVQINTPVNGQGEFQAISSEERYTIRCVGSQTYSEISTTRESDFFLDIQNVAAAPFVKVRVINGIDKVGFQHAPVVLAAEILNESGISIEVASHVEASADGFNFYELAKADTGLFSIDFTSVSGEPFFTKIRVSDSQGKSTVLNVNF